MLNATHFIKEEEQATVLSFAPSKGQTPLLSSVFKEEHSEEHGFPGIFAGQQGPANANQHRPAYYGKIAKSEIHHSDRYAAKSVDNLFFKTKKLQMKHLLEKTQLALRECKRKVPSLQKKSKIPPFNSYEFLFLQEYEVNHITSSPNFPQSNGK